MYKIYTKNTINLCISSFAGKLQWRHFQDWANEANILISTFANYFFFKSRTWWSCWLTSALLCVIYPTVLLQDFFLDERDVSSDPGESCWGPIILIVEIGHELRYLRCVNKEHFLEAKELFGFGRQELASMPEMPSRGARVRKEVGQ